MPLLGQVVVSTSLVWLCRDDYCAGNRDLPSQTLEDRQQTQHPSLEEISAFPVVLVP
jgi:hypothetical protein